jgi:hypothetical protein
MTSVSKHSVTPKLITEVHSALRSLSSNEEIVPMEELKPAVPVRKSVAADFIICLEDGKKFKSLKRHLSTHYNLSPEQYREKWACLPITQWLRQTIRLRAPSLPRITASAARLLKVRPHHKTSFSACH